MLAYLTTNKKNTLRLRDCIILEQLGSAPLSTDVLRTAFKDYASPQDKIAQLVGQGVLIRLKKGLYVTALENGAVAASPYLISNHLYGPSYVSRETALAYYGMIPEHSFNVRAMTLMRSRRIVTSVGRFDYASCPDRYYPVGIAQLVSQSESVLIASPEKALADVIVMSKNLRIQSLSAMSKYLYEDLRLDAEDLFQLDRELLKDIASQGYKEKELTFLLQSIES